VWINFSRPACVYFLGMDVQWFAVAWFLFYYFVTFLAWIFIILYTT
jgi:hypothetical protein